MEAKRAFAISLALTPCERQEGMQHNQRSQTPRHAINSISEQKVIEASKARPYVDTSQRAGFLTSQQGKCPREVRRTYQQDIFGIVGEGYSGLQQCSDLCENTLDRAFQCQNYAF